MQQRQSDIQAAGLQVLAINGTFAEKSVEYVKNYVKTNKIPYPVLLDTEKDTFNKYLIRGVPTTFVLDAKGVIISKQLGFNESYLDSVLKKGTGNFSKN